MKCPACGNIMEKVTVGGITIDVCKGGCGGMWFDRFELEKVDEPQESAGESLLDIERDESIAVDHTKRCMCPTCDDTIMMRHFFSVKREVVVDECPKCAGIWLDYGELGRIRKQFTTEQERKKAAQEYFSDIFDKELKGMREESEEQREKARTLTGIFRFLSPRSDTSRK